LGILLGSSSL
jgi:hypothetical protein